MPPIMNIIAPIISTQPMTNRNGKALPVASTTTSATKTTAPHIHMSVPCPRIASSFRVVSSSHDDTPMG